MALVEKLKDPREFLLSLKERGLSAQEALKTLLSELRVFRAPSRYETFWNPIDSRYELFAVLEESEEVVDRVLLSSFQTAKEAQEKARALNALSPERREKVGFYVQKEEDVQAFLEVLRGVLEVREQIGSEHPLRSLVATRWMEENFPRLSPEEILPAFVRALHRELVQRGVPPRLSREEIARMEVKRYPTFFTVSLPEGEPWEYEFLSFRSTLEDVEERARRLAFAVEKRAKRKE